MVLTSKEAEPEAYEKWDREHEHGSRHGQTTELLEAAESMTIAAGKQENNCRFPK
jgi:hypothetical protein